MWGKAGHTEHINLKKQSAGYICTLSTIYDHFNTKTLLVFTNSGLDKILINTICSSIPLNLIHLENDNYQLTFTSEITYILTVSQIIFMTQL